MARPRSTKRIMTFATSMLNKRLDYLNQKAQGDLKSSEVSEVIDIVKALHPIVKQKEDDMVKRVRDVAKLPTDVIQKKMAAMRAAKNAKEAKEAVGEEAAPAVQGTDSSAGQEADEDVVQ